MNLLASLEPYRGSGLSVVGAGGSLAHVSLYPDSMVGEIPCSSWPTAPALALRLPVRLDRVDGAAGVEATAE